MLCASSNTMRCHNTCTHTRGGGREEGRGREGKGRAKDECNEVKGVVMM
jgi:hypothetical protein